MLAGRILADEGRVRAVDHTIGGHKGSAKFRDGRLQSGREHEVDVVHCLGDALGRLGNRFERRIDILPDRLEWELVDFREDARELCLDVEEGARDQRQHRRLLAPVDRCLGGVREEIEGHVKLPGEQAPAAELSSEPLLLDHPRKERVAFLNAPLNGSGGDRLLVVQAGDEPLRIGDNLHASAQAPCLRVDIEPHM